MLVGAVSERTLFVRSKRGELGAATTSELLGRLVPEVRVLAIAVGRSVKRGHLASS